MLVDKRLGAWTIFAGSMLAFWLELMTGRMLLPIFGSSASVWIVCLGAFQALLLAGYAYAFFLSRLPRRIQSLVHLGLLAAGLLWVALGGLLPGPTRLEQPALAVASVLLRMIAIVFVTLSSGSLLLQSWAAHGSRDRSVYRLYAWSNAGSFVGLALYALALEPRVGLATQRLLWIWLFGVYAGVVMVLAVRGRRSVAAAPSDAQAPTTVAGTVGQAETLRLPAMLAHPAWWVALPALSSALLVAVTNHVTLDFAPLPLVWALLLGAFLLSYVLGFTARAERNLGGIAAVAVVTVALVPFYHRWVAVHGSYLTIVLHGVVLLLVLGWWLHGWLYAIRPATARLPHYYLAVAIGGAVGGLSVSLVPPLVFHNVAEYLLVLLAAGVLLAGFTALGGAGSNLLRARVLLVLLTVVPIFGMVMLARHKSGAPDRTVLAQRSFYGVLRVSELRISTARRPEGGVLRQFFHGHTLHGEQAMLPEWRTRPTTYYSPDSGIGALLLRHPKRKAKTPLHVGIVGLGIGSLAGYAQPVDVYTWYEINPQVVAIATNAALFTYLADCRAVQHVVTADARKAIEYELTLPDMQRFDVLVMDAFANDAPPLHLATREAFALYARRIADDGVLAVNTTNPHLDLVGLCVRLGAEVGLNQARIVWSPEDPANRQDTTVWTLLSRQPLKFALPAGDREIDPKLIGRGTLLTDDKGSALQLLRLGALAQPVRR